MPILRTETGCRWRNTFVSITTTRLRRSRGAGWRKMLFQTWEFLMKSPIDMRHLGCLLSLFHHRVTESTEHDRTASSPPRQNQEGRKAGKSQADSFSLVFFLIS